MFQIHVNVEVQNKSGYGTHKEWKALRPTRGKPYQYNSFGEANQIMNMCYPLESPNTVKVVEIKDK